METPTVTNTRRGSHGRTREPQLEPFLARYRYRFSLRIIRTIADSGTKVKGFDIGCGYRGEFVQQANEIPDVEFYGGDLDICDNSRLREFDVAAPDLLPYTPNVITMHAVLEHVIDPESVVRYVHATLTPGGYFLFTAPSNMAKPVLEFLSFKLGLVSRQEIEDHKQYFNRKSCFALLGQTNACFNDIRHQYFQFGLNNRVVARR